MTDEKTKANIIDFRAIVENKITGEVSFIMESYDSDRGMYSDFVLNSDGCTNEDILFTIEKKKRDLETSQKEVSELEKILTRRGEKKNE